MDQDGFVTYCAGVYLMHVFFTNRDTRTINRSICSSFEEQSFS